MELLPSLLCPVACDVGYHWRMDRLPKFLGFGLKMESVPRKDVYNYSAFKKLEQLDLATPWGLLGVVFGLGSYENAMGDKMNRLKACHIETGGLGCPDREISRNLVVRGHIKLFLNTFQQKQRGPREMLMTLRTGSMRPWKRQSSKHAPRFLWLSAIEGMWWMVGRGDRAWFGDE